MASPALFRVSGSAPVAQNRILSVEAGWLQTLFQLSIKSKVSMHPKKIKIKSLIAGLN